MKQSTKRLVSFSVATALLIAAVFVFLNMVQPSYNEVQAMRGSNLSKSNLFEIQKKSVKAVQDLIAKTNQADQQQYEANISAALPAMRDESGLVYQLSQMASINHLAVQSITVAAPGSQNVAAQSPKAGLILVKPVGRINVQARFAGTYGDFKSFLGNLENNLRIMDIGSVSISPVAKSTQDFYVIDISIVAYYQNG